MKGNCGFCIEMECSWKKKSETLKTLHRRVVNSVFDEIKWVVTWDRKWRVAVGREDFKKRSRQN